MDSIAPTVQKAAKYAEENSLILGCGAAAAVVATFFAMRKPTMERNRKDFDSQLSGVVRILNNEDHTLDKKQIGEAAKSYLDKFDGARKETGTISSEASIQRRRDEYGDMVDEFYNLVTDFYEWGWGQSFHFGPRYVNETFDESIKRAEYHLASRLHLKPGMKIVDVGCGVGGPMRNIAMFSGCDITGITINQYQVNIGNSYNKSLHLQDSCRLIQGDFQTQPFKDNQFDGAYEIEATCHSPDRIATYTEVCRVLKTGAHFTGYEWCMTDKYDPKNVDHVRMKEGIEEGNGLPTLVHWDEIVSDLEKSGFEVVEAYDANRGLHDKNQIPWYYTLDGSYSLSGFRMTYAGRMVTHSMVWIMETLFIAPPGSTRISQMLNQTAVDLCESGKVEIFTPSFYFLAKKK